MPGMIGGFSKNTDFINSFRLNFQSIWSGVKLYQKNNMFLGLHSFNSMDVLKYEKDIYFVVDGEYGIYKDALKFSEHKKPILFQLNNNKIETSKKCRGNVAVIDFGNKLIYISTDTIGAFPLYCYHDGDTFIFSSHLKPLAKSLKSEVDPYGVIQFMRFGYILNGRTHFKNIQRILPGQSVVCDMKCFTLEFYENSQAWSKKFVIDNDIKIIDNYWHLLNNAIDNSNIEKEQLVLMSSAGWDSRLLLAGLIENNSNNILCYSHGDTTSRELEITKNIISKVCSKCHFESIDNSIYDLDNLKNAFEKVENVVFPHWHRAGMMAKSYGAHTVTAGVLGEIVGGHYGRSMYQGNFGKIFTLLSNLIYKKNKQITKNDCYDEAFNILVSRKFSKPWYINIDYWNSLRDFEESFYNDLYNFIMRYKKRGVATTDQIIEAYISETRGSQYIIAQLLSCRTNVDITNIFGDRELLEFSSSIPFSIKIHNMFTQNIMKKYAPALLEYPTSAILTKANSPLLVQEVSRLARKIYDEISYKMLRSVSGTIKTKHLGWDNFEFLRDGYVLDNLLNNFTNEALDTAAIRAKISDMKNYKTNFPLFSISNQFMTIFTTDLFLRV